MIAAKSPVWWMNKKALDPRIVSGASKHSGLVVSPIQRRRRVEGCWSMTSGCVVLVEDETTIEKAEDKDNSPECPAAIAEAAIKIYEDEAVQKRNRSDYFDIVP